MSAPIPIYRWANYVRRGLTIMHAHCHRLAPASVQNMHGHDFAELFWCFHGACSQHLNGVASTLSIGDLVLIRPGDVHEIRTAPDQACFYYLVCFPAAVFERLRDDFPDLVGIFWSDAPGRRMRHLSVRDTGRFEREFLELQRNPHSPLLLQRFLLNLLHDLHVAPLDPLRDCPDWLRQACQDLAVDPGRLAQGGKALVELTGRSREHIARTLQRSAGLTTSGLVNRMRIDHATARLILSDEPIAHIAIDCGYESLSHFYAAFRRATGSTPRAYRLQHQTSIDSR